MEQAGIPATLVDLSLEGVWFESHLEEQISLQGFFFYFYFYFYFYFMVLLLSGRCEGCTVMNP
jgi:hypothetical protein